MAQEQASRQHQLPQSDNEAPPPKPSGLKEISEADDLKNPHQIDTGTFNSEFVNSTEPDHSSVNDHDHEAPHSDDSSDSGGDGPGALALSDILARRSQRLPATAHDSALPGDAGSDPPVLPEYTGRYLSEKEFEECITRFLATNDPREVHRAPALAKMYFGRESRLASRLWSKYGRSLLVPQGRLSRQEKHIL